jgi:hypothetical protein
MCKCYYFNYLRKLNNQTHAILRYSAARLSSNVFLFLQKIKQVVKVPLFLSYQKHGLQILNFFPNAKILEAFTDEINDAQGVW